MTNISINHVEHFVQGNMYLYQTVVGANVHVAPATRQAEPTAAPEPPHEAGPEVVTGPFDAFPELGTPAAMLLWQRAQRHKWVDKDYQPLHLTRVQVAILAFLMSEALQLTYKWTTFERFWRRRHMRTDYCHALNQGNYGQLLTELKRGLGLDGQA